jgi:GTP pyrophosphokinase
VVDILTSKKSTPSRDWIKIAKTQSAKSKIKAWFKKHEREDIIHRGKEALQETLIQINREVKNDEIFSKADTALSKIIKSGQLEKAGKNYSFINIEEIFYQIGIGKLSPRTIIDDIFPKVSEFKLAIKRKKTLENQKKKKKKRLSDGIKVAGIENMEVNFAKCCKPLPGDDIIGFITVGRGITVHRADCYNMKFLNERPERIAHVAWTKEDEDRGFFVNVKIKALDRRNLLQNVISLLANERINIYSAKAITESSDIAQLSFTLEIKNKTQLENLLSHIRKIPGIIDVMRVDAAIK